MWNQKKVFYFFIKNKKFKINKISKKFYIGNSFKKDDMDLFIKYYYH